MVAHQSSIWGVLAYDVPFMTLLVLLIGVIHLGLIGRAYEDALREWWARLGGILLTIGFFWFVICVLVFYCPLWVEAIFQFLTSRNGASRIWKFLTSLGIASVITGWITTSLKGIFAAKSSKTGPRPGSNPKEDRLAQLAPPLFVFGLVVILSLALYWLVPTAFGEDPMPFWLIGGRWRQALGTCVILYAISRFVGYRVDVNEFSLHNAYRNRLVRCYLGATNRNRKPQSFTGFDETDNIFMHHLESLAVPFHVVNATLNVVTGKELALQSRKGRSFIFTPLYSGFDFTQDQSVTSMPGTRNIEGSKGATHDARVFKTPAYRPTKTCSLKSRYPGARLGTAMAISGAAASP